MRYLVDVDKPSIEDLSHFGVKGMHWGVTREKDKPKKKFSDEEVTRMKRSGRKTVIRTLGTIGWVTATAISRAVGSI